jgi:hypothetical protein
MIDLETRSRNKKLDTEGVLSLINERQDIKKHAYVVGAWVWVEFSEKPGREVLDYLSELGFTWNNKRKVWQHCCGVYRHADRRGDPRYRYGVQRLNNETDD